MHSQSPEMSVILSAASVSGMQCLVSMCRQAAICLLGMCPGSRHHGYPDIDYKHAFHL